MNNASNINLRKALTLSAIFFLTFLFSCKKDGKLAPDFDNGNLTVSFVDTFSIVTSIVQETPLRTDGLSTNLLGIYNDSIFGPVSSSIYTQVLLTGLNVDFNSSDFDSIVLTLDYSELYGNTTTPMSINVYEIDELMSLDNDYYSNTYITHKPTPEASKTFTPNLTDSVDVYIGLDTIIQKPHLRVRLTDAFGQALLAADASGTNMMTDNSTFTNFMKGLYITTVDSVTNTSLPQSDGSIAYFDMNSAMSTLTIYYNDTSSYDFTINSSAEKYSRFAHNYTGTDVEKHLNNDISKNVNRTYVSSMAGVKTKIELPFIKDLVKDGNIIINKAEITFTIENGSEGSVDSVDQTLYLVGIDANGTQIQLLDDPLIEGIEHYGGKYDNSTESYTFNISRHIHQLLQNTSPDYGMYLVSNGALTEANRAVLGSEKSPIYKIRLEITYSNI